MPNLSARNAFWAFISAAALTGCGSDGSAGNSAGSGGSAGSTANSSGGASSAGVNAGGNVSTSGGGGSAGLAGTSGSSESAGTGGTAGSGGTSGSGGSSGVGGSGGTGVQVTAGNGPSSTRQTAHPLGDGSGAPTGYYEYVPPGYGNSTPTPLLVFWSGLGQDGNGTSDLPKALVLGPTAQIKNDKWDNSRPFIVLTPQFTPQSNDIVPGGACPSGTNIDAFITWAISKYNVDPKRIYLTGLSCGGIGIWDYLKLKQGSVVAAAVPIAGSPGDPNQATSAWGAKGCSLGTAAIWSFHGDQDNVVPYAPDHDTTTNIIACPQPPRRDVRFKQIAGGGHGGWDQIYDLTSGYGDIYKWMLDNAKP